MKLRLRSCNVRKSNDTIEIPTYPSNFVCKQFEDRASLSLASHIKIMGSRTNYKSRPCNRGHCELMRFLISLHNPCVKRRQRNEFVWAIDGPLSRKSPSVNGNAKRCLRRFLRTICEGTVPWLMTTNSPPLFLIFHFTNVSFQVLPKNAVIHTRSRRYLPGCVMQLRNADIKMRLVLNIFLLSLLPSKFCG